jgi:hypothetical protein
MAPNVDNLLKWIMGEMKKRFLVKAVPQTEECRHSTDYSSQISRATA